MSNTATDLYLVYNVLRRLTTPFQKWDAYKSGVIDDQGTILIQKDQRTSSQKDSLKTFDVMVLNMKKLLARLPGGASQFATFAAAMFLIKEDKEIDEMGFKKYLSEQYSVELHETITNSIGAAGVVMHADPSDIIIDHETIEDKTDDSIFWAAPDVIPQHLHHERNKYAYDEHLKRVIAQATARIRGETIKEEVVANNVGSGNIAGMKGDGPAKFAGAKVFHADHDKMMKSRFGKHPRHRYAKYLGEDESAEEIRQYSKSNPRQSIVLKDPKTGAMMYLRRK